MRIAEISASLLFKGKDESQSFDFYYTNIDVPKEMESLTVTVATHSPSFCQIPFALFSPSLALRILKVSEGGEGDYESSCTIGVSSSDKGGISGPIEPGVWKLVLQKRRFSQDVGVTIAIEGKEKLPNSQECTVAPKGKRCYASKPGWYSGELHIHSNHSTGRDSIPAIIQAAQEAKLDFIAITDHFTVSHWEEERTLDPPILILQSMELSGNRGHANLHGIKEVKNPYVDDDGTLASFFGVDKLPSVEDIADSVHEEGGLFCVNHYDSNLASAWRYHEFPMEKADLLEVWCSAEGDASFRLPAIWDQFLKQGMKVTGVCSSDSHKAKGHPFWEIGRIKTHVYANELSQKGIVEGLKKGRAFMGKGEALLDFYAIGKGGRFCMGDTVDDVSTASFVVELTKIPKGNLVVYLSGQVYDIVHFEETAGEETASYSFSVPMEQIGKERLQYVRLEYYEELSKPRFYGDFVKTQSSLRLLSNPIYFEEAFEKLVLQKPLKGKAMNHKNIAIFCGSSLGKDPSLKENAVLLGNALAERKCNLVYGGGNRGLMGVFAQTMKQVGSRVIGVSPKRFNESNEKDPLEIDEYYVVDTMQERKARMYDKADAIVVYPGGTGTLDEMAEVITLKNLGFHGKPIVIINLNGFYDGLVALLGTMEREGLWTDKGNFKIVDTVGETIDYLENAETFKGAYEA